MNQSASISTHDEFNMKGADSPTEHALERLEKNLESVTGEVFRLIGRLDLVLQSEEASDQKEALVSPMQPTSRLVRRIDEISGRLDHLARRVNAEIDRLDV